MSKATSKEAMKRLHVAVANALAEELEPQFDDKGRRIRVDPKMLANAIAFLKNNGVVCEDDDPALKDLKDKTKDLLQFPFGVETEREPLGP